MFRLSAGRLRPSRSGTRVAALQSNPFWTQLNTSTRLYAHYPKEGVFQPNSPNKAIPSVEHSHPHQSFQEARAQNTPLQETEAYTQSPPQQQKRRFPWMLIIGTVWFSLIWSETFDRLDGLGISKGFMGEPGSAEDVAAIKASRADLRDRHWHAKLMLEDTISDEDRQEPKNPAATPWPQLDNLSFMDNPSHDRRSWIAYSGFSDERKDQRLTTGPMAGARGLGEQYVHYSESMKILFVFVKFGPALTGWPGIVHGGALATVFDEALGRLAILSTEEKYGVTANLKIKYRKPVETDKWYVVSVQFDPLKDSTNSKKFVKASISQLNDNSSQEMVADISAEAEALFIVPKIKLSPLPENF